MKKIVFSAVAAVVLAAVLIFIHFGENAKSDRILVTGNIEVTDIEIAFKLPGLIAERAVEEGEAVEIGGLVARLEAGDLRQEVAVREAEVSSAQAVLAELEAGSRPEEIARAEAAVKEAAARLDELVNGSRPEEIAAAEAALERARADLSLAEEEYGRQKALYEERTISQSAYDSAVARYRAGEAQLRETEEALKLVRAGPRVERIEQARAALDTATQNLAIAVKGPRKEKIEQARARLRQAQAALALARTRLSYATLLSPVAGIVLSEASDAGEFVSAGTPVVTIADLSRVWLRAYIPETELGRVRVGQSVEVTTDTYPGKIYKGRVSFIASQAEFTPKNVQTEKQRVKLVYRIKVDVPNPEMELKPGMPADAALIVGEDVLGAVK